MAILWRLLESSGFGAVNKGARVELVEDLAILELAAEHERLRVRVHLQHHALHHDLACSRIFHRLHSWEDTTIARCQTTESPCSWGRGGNLLVGTRKMLFLQGNQKDACSMRNIFAST